MIISVSSTAFCRFINTHPVGQVDVVNEARSRIGAHLHLREQNDPWRGLRALSVRLLCDQLTPAVYRRRVVGLSDTEQRPDHLDVADALLTWYEGHPMAAEPINGRTWTHNGLTIVVNPDVRVRWDDAQSLVVVLSFGAQPLTKAAAQPMLRLIERTHGTQGIPAVLDVRRGRMHTGLSGACRKLDAQLSSEAANYVELWSSIERRTTDRPAL